MNATILHDPTFPHGSPKGYLQGCHGSHCPSVIPCRDVHRRYVGDFQFHRAFKSGETLESIHARETAAAQQAVVEPRSPRARRAPGRPGEPREPVTTMQVLVTKFVNEGLTDREIGERLGRTRDQAAATRKWLRLPCNRVTPRKAAA